MLIICYYILNQQKLMRDFMAEKAEQHKYEGVSAPDAAIGNASTNMTKAMIVGAVVTAACVAANNIAHLPVAQHTNLIAGTIALAILGSGIKGAFDGVKHVNETKQQIDELTNQNEELNFMINTIQNQGRLQTEVKEKAV
jgi:hypothetical protein